MAGKLDRVTSGVLQRALSLGQEAQSLLGDQAKGACSDKTVIRCNG